MPQSIAGNRTRNAVLKSIAQPRASAPAQRAKGERRRSSARPGRGRSSHWGEEVRESIMARRTATAVAAGALALDGFSVAAVT
jgi:hypothetical protein